jgi:S-DNA-T family DNA segregation ATPase FtsK/SpoIIIE
MNEQRYILTVQSNNIFREVDVSADTPLLKIGTLQDCDVRLKRELFGFPVGLTLRSENDEWCISCDEGLFICSASAKECTQTSINHGDILTIHSSLDKKSILTLTFAYDFTVNAIDFDTIIDIRNINNLTIGNAPSAQLKLKSKFVDNEYITLARGKDGSFTLNPSHAPSGATLNGIRIFENVIVQECDFIGIADYSFYFKNQVLYTAMREDLQISGVSSQPLRDETPAFEYPKLNRSPRMLYAFNTDPIEVLNPPQKPSKPKDNLVLQLAPALLMIVVVIIVRSGLIGGGGGGNMTFLIFSIAMMGVGLFTSLMTFVHNKSRYKKDLAEWHDDYSDYIAKKRVEIETEQKKEVAALIDLYPAFEQSREFVKTFSGRLFERSLNDADFLHVRAGLGKVPALRPIENRKEEHVKKQNELELIPKAICEEYAFIDKAPVMLHLREAGSVGIIGTPDEQYEYFKNMLLEVCVQHFYEEVQVVVLIPQNQQHRYEWIKWLPHLKESGGGIRGIICDDESRDNVFEYLYALMSMRNAEQSENDKISPLPHIVVFALEEYGIKTHPLFKFAEKSTSLGLSFVHFKQYKENLPQHCLEIIQLNSNGGVLRLRENKAFKCSFSREQIEDDSIKFVTERLTPVFCEKIALSSRLTANITLFELLNIISPEDLNLIERWKKSNVQKTLAAPLGVDVKGYVVNLDLHERAHGPHGLVAGTTGSGKSEIMQSYILSAAVNFHPYEVSFVIIDFKGGGMANQFERLPHLIGKITDIDSHEINRSLLSIRAELEKRKRLFAEFEVNHIDKYIAKYRSAETNVPLPHLILIVDEFAELKAEQPEFMKELISTARVGRSLGIHLILATQKPAGQVNEQIWSNSRFKLCLKVATKEDSNEVLKSPLASEILEPGRAYLQVGNNEVFTLFQSAYSGASAVSDKNGNIREFSVSEVSFTGKRIVVYERKAERSSDGSKLTQLKAMVEYINSYCEEASISRLPSICLPPLPEVVAYEPVKAIASVGTSVRVGIYDDPSNQTQPEVEVNLLDGNVMVIGSAQTGKTMLLQTMLRGIAENYSPNQVSVYILDFASKILKTYENMNHVGNVLTDADDEKLKNFFKMMKEEIDNRKEQFSQLGISSYEAYLEMKPLDAHVMPHIVILVDNLSVFKEIFQDYEDDMLNICREGLALGISIIATSKQTAGLSYRYFSNFSTRLTFSCTESSEYNNIFDRCQIQPKNLQGRGLVAVDKIVYEYQAYLPFDGETESQRIEQARAFIADIEKVYGTERARSVPSIPTVLFNDYWKQGSYRFDKYVIPVGLTYGEIEPVTIDLARAGAVGIYGREGFGKSNLMRIILNYLQQNVFNLPCEAYVIDGYDRQLAEFEICGFIERFTIDCAEFEGIVQKFTDIAQARMEILQSGGNLDNEPLMLCIVQNQQIFATDVIVRTVSDQFKKLIGDAKQFKICFIFSNIENNSDYSPPEMMKAVREFSQYFFLDDIANVKLFGSSSSKLAPNDIKEFKKPISLGDGYTYNSRDGIEKIKLVKSEK